MSNEITLTQQIRVVNGNFQFPGPTGNFGNSGANANQTTLGGGSPGEISAVTAANGTLVDLATFSPVMAGGGWCIFKNADPTNFVDWGPDNAGTTLIPAGRLYPGMIAGPFQGTPLKTKYRFQADTAACPVQVFFFTP